MNKFVFEKYFKLESVAIALNSVFAGAPASDVRGQGEFFSALEGSLLELKRNYNQDILFTKEKEYSFGIGIKFA